MVVYFDLFDEDWMSVFQSDHFVWSDTVKTFLVFQFYIWKLDVDSFGKFDLTSTFLFVFGE